MTVSGISQPPLVTFSEQGAARVQSSQDTLVSTEIFGHYAVTNIIVCDSTGAEVETSFLSTAETGQDTNTRTHSQDEAKGIPGSSSKVPKLHPENVYEWCFTSNRLGIVLSDEKPSPPCVEENNSGNRLPMIGDELIEVRHAKPGT